MEMTGNIYVNPGGFADDRSDIDDGTHLCKNIYMNEENLENHTTKNQGTKTKEPEHTGNVTAGSRCYRWATNCLGLLCVFLLTAIIVMCVLVTAKKQQFLTSYNNLTMERDQLLSSYNNLSMERDQLLSNYDNLVLENDQLKMNNSNLNAERYNLEREKDQLHDKINQITSEKAGLQTNYDTMKNERDQLQKEKEELPNKLFDLGICNFKIGDKVRVKASVQTPKYQWGSVSHKSVGRITGYECLNAKMTVTFPEFSGWTAYPPEMELVS